MIKASLFLATLVFWLTFGVFIAYPKGVETPQLAHLLLKVNHLACGISTLYICSIGLLWTWYTMAREKSEREAD